MKIFYASLIQETNTFCPQKTDLALFERGYVLRGEEIPRHLAGTNTEIGGFLSYFSEHPADLVPAVACWGVACGKVEDAAFAQLSGGDPRCPGGAAPGGRRAAGTSRRHGL